MDETEVNEWEKIFGCAFKCDLAKKVFCNGLMAIKRLSLSLSLCYPWAKNIKIDKNQVMAVLL